MLVGTRSIHPPSQTVDDISLVVPSTKRVRLRGHTDFCAGTSMYGIRGGNTIVVVENLLQDPS